MIMKIVLTTLLLFCLIPFVGLADDSSDELFVGGGGPMPTLLFLDLEDLNGAITDGGYPQLTEILFANGGGGYGGMLDGFRIGGYGLGGDTSAVSGSRSVTLNMEYGGLLMENAVSNNDDFTVVVGTLLGLGSLDLHFVIEAPETFEEAIANPFISSISKDFYAVHPYIAFEAKPLSWMWTRFQVGYLWTLAGDWSFEEAEFTGPPRSLGGLTLGIMIRFGGGDPFLDLDEVEAALDELSEELDALDDSDSDATEAVPTDVVEEPVEDETE
jgi:hypothetical protein